YDAGDQDYAWKKNSYDVLREGIKHAEVQSFSATPKQIAWNQFSTLDRFSEMQEIARRCKQLIVEEGCAPDDIVVVARNIEPYHPAVDTAFKEAGIPYFLDHEIPLLSLPVAQFVKKLFGLYANDFVRADAMFVLRSWYFRLDQIGLSKDKLDAIDIASLNS